MITLPSYFQPHQTARVVMHHDQATSDPFNKITQPEVWKLS